MNIQQLKALRLEITLLDSSKKSFLIKNKNFRSYLVATNQVLGNFLNQKTDSFCGIPKQVKVVSVFISLCGKAKITKLNATYRQKNTVTDVLSFPVHINLRKPQKFYNEITDLGDIFICKEKALSQSKEFNITLENEIVHLMCHGFLHLLGYDHELNKSEEKFMFDVENKLVKLILKKATK
jgi:probable rRNA maturation factor